MRKLEEVLSPEVLEEFDEVMHLLTRIAPLRRAKTSSTAITPDIVEKVRMYFLKHKDASQLEIAKKFNTNPGRISEILHGKYDT